MVDVDYQFQVLIMDLGIVLYLNGVSGCHPLRHHSLYIYVSVCGHDYIRYVILC